MGCESTFSGSIFSPSSYVFQLKLRVSGTFFCSFFDAFFVAFFCVFPSKTQKKAPPPPLSPGPPS